jgi:integrative and conjugative element protein (TIGR02256 family)
MQHRQLNSQLSEAGGVLLGRLLLDESVIVDEATPPVPSDRRGPFSFFRSRGPAQKRVRAAWRQTQQTRNYLGEWHTHPEDHPRPSSHDEANWKRILKGAKFEQECLFFVIVGCASVTAWEVSKIDLELTRLGRIDDASW